MLNNSFSPSIQDAESLGFESRLQSLERRVEKNELIESLLGLKPPKDSIDLSAWQDLIVNQSPKLKYFQDYVADKLFLFFCATEVASFNLLKIETKTAHDKFYNHLGKIITSIPAIGTLLKGLETTEVAVSIADNSINDYSSLLPFEIPSEYAIPLNIEVTSVELKRRLQSRHIAVELSKQYYEQLILVAESNIFLPAHYAVYAIINYLKYYISRKAKKKHVCELSISNITDAVATHRQDNPLAQQKLTLVKTANQPYRWRVGELFGSTGILDNQTQKSYSCDPKKYDKGSRDNPHGLALVYGDRQLSGKHANHFMKCTDSLPWHLAPLNRFSEAQKEQLLAPLKSKSFKDKFILTCWPSSQKISKALVRMMSLVLLISSVTLVMLGIAAIRDGGFLNDLFLSVTNALGLNALSGSLILVAGISFLVLLGISYLCLWFEDEKPPVYASYKPKVAIVAQAASVRLRESTITDATKLGRQLKNLGSYVPLISREVKNKPNIPGSSIKNDLIQEEEKPQIAFSQIS